MSQSGPLAVPDFLAVARQIVEAVRDAHTRNVYPRDLKPSNVMARRLVNGSWDVRVIDFVLAVRFDRVFQAGINQASGRSTENDRSMTGPLEFAPPEQRGKLTGAKVGPYSDVYAFGKTSQWLLFRTTESLQSAHLRRIPEPYRDALRSLIEAATAPDVVPNAIFELKDQALTQDQKRMLVHSLRLLKPGFEPPDGGDRYGAQGGSPGRQHV